MTLIYQSNFVTTVHRLNAAEMLARSHLLSTDREAVASIKAATASFDIAEARWDVLRSPGGALNGGREVGELKGTKAYLGAGAALRAATRGDGELARQLLAECVKGAIQAETYLYRDRGFASSDVYESEWKKSYTGSCRLYSNRDYKGRSWYEHVADRAWSDNLFIRCKTAAVRAGRGGLAVSGSFSDAFHELGITVDVADGVVVAATGNFLRAPDPVCRQTPETLPALVGQEISALSREAAGHLVGGAQGCAHLADLVDFLMQAARAAVACRE